MRLAWFSPHAPDAPAPTDDTALLVRALRGRHEIDLFDARGAHDFVWRQARRPYDLCVYELDNTPAHQFVWPYLAHYPGLTLLRRLTLRASCPDAPPRDDLLIPLYGSRLVVVPWSATAESLRADYPGARVRHATPGVEPLPGSPDDIVVSLEWPSAGAALTDALAGFAAGRPVVVFDCTETADWPSLNPQDWQPRFRLPPAPPMCVSIDPRDEEHSRRLAMRRLSGDPALRGAIGAAAQAWWRANATVPLAAAAFESLLADARSVAPPARPPSWPPDAADDGTQLARRLLEPFGMTWQDLGLPTPDIQAPS